MNIVRLCLTLVFCFSVEQHILFCMKNIYLNDQFYLDDLDDNDGNCSKKQKIEKTENIGEHNREQKQNDEEKSKQFLYDAQQSKELLKHCNILFSPSFEKVKILLENGANPNVQYSDGTTPLHALFNRHGDFFESTGKSITVLFENGANLNARDEDNCTPLHIHFSNNAHLTHVAIIKLFVNLQLQSLKNAVFTYMLCIKRIPAQLKLPKFVNFEILKHVLEPIKQSFQAKDSSGRTALMYAQETLQRLKVEGGYCDQIQQCVECLIALDAAFNKGYPDLIECMQLIDFI